jgi:predicted transcriptional regulator
LSNASASGSNIIITPDESIKDIIDPEYPYLMKDDTLEEARRMVEYVKETYGGPVWEKGLEMMEVIRQKTSLNKVIPKYVELFQELD